MEQFAALLELSALMSLVSVATLLTFRFAGFPDLSVDGVFALGGAVLFRFLESGAPVSVAILAGILAGAGVGLLTAGISHRLKIHPLLASVLVLIALYSVNIRTLGGANRSFIGLVGLDATDAVAGTLIVLVPVVVIGVLVVLARTEVGIAYRATGSYASYLPTVGRNVAAQRIVLVALASALVATAGLLMSLRYSYSDVSMGNGVVIAGIAALIVGEKMCSRWPTFGLVLAAPVGMLLYQAAVAGALRLGVSPVDVKLASAVIAVLLLATTRGRDGITAA